MAMTTGGDLAILTLLQAGVTRVFALYGGHLEALFQGCRAHQLPVMDVRHEAAAGYAAEGYARAGQTLGVAFVTAGPGITNAITSIANAYLDRTPVLYICGAAPLGSGDTNTVQGGFDQLDLVKPITKWAQRATEPLAIPRLVAHAIRVATTEPTGPVVLELPIDVSLAPVDLSAAVIPRTIASHTPVQPAPALVRSAIALLAAAQRPAILAGEGVWKSNAAEELRAFAEASGIPVFADHEAQGAMPSSHRLYAGRLFSLANLTAPDERPDAVLALGLRFGTFTLGRSHRLFPADAKLIHVDVDGRELGRIRDVDVAIAADSRETLRALLLSYGASNRFDLRAWQERLKHRDSSRHERFASLDKGTQRIHPYLAAAAIVEALESDTVLIGDGAEAAHWLIEVVRQDTPGSFFTHGQLGALGFGLGFSIGVQVARPKSQVLCVIGDGGVGITFSEFDTMARHGLPIVTVVLNNRSWGATRHFQDLLSGPGKNIAVDLGAARYDLAAEGLGCQGYYVTQLADIAPAVKAAFANGKPACINIEVDQAPTPPESEILMTST